MKNNILAAASVFLATNLALALPVCRNLFSQRPDVAAFVSIDGPRQWLEWEQKANFSIFRKSSAPLAVEKIAIDKNSLNVTFLKSAPENLRSLILEKNGNTNWFKHPFNTLSTLPHFTETSTESLTTYQTASRSLALILGNNVYTLKMGADYPHGPKGQYQPAKASTKEDIVDGINRMSYVEKVDSKIGIDPTLILAKEIAMVADKKTGEGYLFRDLTFMNDGNYYLPALSIPYVGREIARLNNEEPNSFWEKNYAELLGRAKAKLILRYGLQMETPNSQNMLIQLDVNLKPTGVIVFRDISDTILIKAVAEGLGESATLQKDIELGVENGTSIMPYWSNSAWRFDEAGIDSFTNTTLQSWGRTHDIAYTQEIEKALSVDLSEFKNRVDNNTTFNKFMSTDIVKQKLKKHRQQLILELKKQKKNAA
jgi:hypothetical protein